MDLISSLCLYLGFCGALGTAFTTGNIGAYICAGILGLAMAINNKYIDKE